MAKVDENPRFQGFHIAMGTDIGEVEMIEYDRFKAHSLTPNNPHATRFNKQGRGIRIQETTLDTFCSEHSIDNIDLLKTDVEGFDLVVLQGSSLMMQKRAVKFIMVEFFDLLPKQGVFGGALMPSKTCWGPSDSDSLPPITITSAPQAKCSPHRTLFSACPRTGDLE
jgi:FkbM family methyltransferase